MAVRLTHGALSLASIALAYVFYTIGYYFQSMGGYPVNDGLGWTAAIALAAAVPSAVGVLVGPRALWLLPVVSLLLLSVTILGAFLISAFLYVM